jgi:hypothetical protein
VAVTPPTSTLHADGVPMEYLLTEFGFERIHIRGGAAGKRSLAACRPQSVRVSSAC